MLPAPPGAPSGSGAPAVESHPPRCGQSQDQLALPSLPAMVTSVTSHSGFFPSSLVVN